MSQGSNLSGIFLWFKYIFLKNGKRNCEVIEVASLITPFERGANPLQMVLKKINFKKRRGTLVYLF